MARIASFHLVRHTAVTAALRSRAFDRRRLDATPGLLFWKLLGTARGRETGPGSDFRRTALLAVWERDGDLSSFVAGPLPSWREAAERYDVRLRAITGHGAWRGTDVLTGVVPGDARGPIAVLTRASVRRGSWARFRAASVAVNADLQQADGLLAAVGIGETPIGRLGTFSLWSNATAVDAFAASPCHADAVRRTREQHWFGEELFARFEPYASSGTWDGHDPLTAT